MTTHRDLRIGSDPDTSSAIHTSPPDAAACYVLAHGAGAGMRHPFMAAVADGLCQRGIATLRYQFLYMERKSRRPDSAPVAHAMVRAAVDAATAVSNGRPLVAGGKSFGGRMTSQAQAQAPLPGVRGLVFLGFPLHAAGRPSVDRATHLSDIHVPMLFLQGTRDALADLTLLEPLVRGLGAKATLHTISGADHSFHVPRRSGATDEQALAHVLDTLAAWTRRVIASA